MRHQPKSAFAPAPRHARLFELIRQENIVTRLKAAPKSDVVKRHSISGLVAAYLQETAHNSLAYEVKSPL